MANVMLCFLAVLEKYFVKLGKLDNFTQKVQIRKSRV